MIAKIVILFIGIIIGAMGMMVLAVVMLAGDISRQTDRWVNGEYDPRGGDKR